MSVKARNNISQFHEILVFEYASLRARDTGSKGRLAPPPALEESLQLCFVLPEMRTVTLVPTGAPHCTENRMLIELRTLAGRPAAAQGTHAPPQALC